jgi:hypothetical protein
MASLLAPIDQQVLQFNQNKIIAAHLSIISAWLCALAKNNEKGVTLSDEFCEASGEMDGTLETIQPIINEVDELAKKSGMFNNELTDF